MGKTKELKTTQDVVKEVLENDIESRNSDDHLIFEVCKKINPMCLGMPFETVIKNRKALGLPVFETIRRTGQKMRAAHPELAGCDDVEEQRMLNEQIYRDYARGMV